jgi:hypothetical protein
VLRFRLMVKGSPWMRPQTSEGEPQMDYFAGLDVSVRDTSVCIVDETGRITLEVKGAIVSLPTPKTVAPLNPAEINPGLAPDMNTPLRTQ